ncbi:MAG: CBS domain-containing protein [Betaproteobacteria bacterium]|jgi:CBS domain-containing protein|nr:CBS domain-containing protein [Betaproteobacteria bacterium]
MYSQRVRDVMDRKKLLLAAPGTSVSTAAKQMAKMKVSAVMILEEEKLVGIFTERDAVSRVIAKDRDPLATKLADVMTADPQTISPDKTFGYALLIMHENGFRHVPVVANDRVIGIVSARNALDPDLEEFVAESHRREEIVRANA